jgi:SprT-like protein
LESVSVDEYKKSLLKKLEIPLWNTNLIKSGIKGKKQIEKHFIKFTSGLPISDADKKAIASSTHLFDGNKLLFRLSDGKLNKINVKNKKKELKSDLKLCDLYRFARENSMEYWQREFDIEIELVTYNWKRTNGSYNRYSDGRKVIRMSKIRNQYRSSEQVFSTLLHEMVHWHLHTSGIPHRDTDKEFIAEIKRVGSHFSSTIKAQKALKDYEKTIAEL